MWISGYNPFYEKTLTPAEKKKREEIAQAIERDNPGMDKSKKMAIATDTAKDVAEKKNPMAKEIQDPKYRPRVVKDKTKYTRKDKHKKMSMEDAISEIVGWGSKAKPGRATRTVKKDKGDPNIKPITGNPLRDKYIRKGLIKR